jgi:hypothetical protein
MPEGLQRLRNRRTPDVGSSTAASAESFAPSHASNGDVDISKARKRTTKRVKPGKEIKHPIEMLNLFEQIEISCPTLYQDVTLKLVQVRERFDFFLNLTKLVVTVSFLFYCDSYSETSRGLKTCTGTWTRCTAEHLVRAD